MDDRAPQVVIRVVSPDSNTLEAIGLYFEELQAGSHRTLEMDFCCTLVVGKKAIQQLIDDWDLDLDDLYWRQPYVPRRRVTPKLVHKLVFSMPAGTPPESLLAAVRDFAEQEFAGQYRYALALHTDETNPHVHMVLKAMTEDLVHLNIRKPMLRRWREEFARHLRGRGCVRAPRPAPVAGTLGRPGCLVYADPGGLVRLTGSNNTFEAGEGCRSADTPRPRPFQPTRPHSRNSEQILGIFEHRQSTADSGEFWGKETMNAG